MANSQGNPTINGLGILFQAAEAFELWTGKEMPDLIWQLLVQKYDIK